MEELYTIEELPKCRKCGEPVSPDNDVTVFDFLMLLKLKPFMGGLPLAVFRLCKAHGGAQHLLPTGECEGSPSRAQYLEGQEVDKRGLYPLRPKLQALYREVWKRMEAYAPVEEPSAAE
jgi:hypothetical protein